MLIYLRGSKKEEKYKNIKYGREIIQYTQIV